ncbi:MAG: UDP-N-acetylmuramoyl-L-alanyl-D-glutamate--2,6-diaminopimelate ligase [Woeseia sp.]
MSLTAEAELTMAKRKAKETAARSLRWLLNGIADAPPVAITGISADSRTVAKGDVFLACRGATNHGLTFTADVIASGAAAIVWDSETDGQPGADEGVKDGVVMVPVAGLSDRLGEIANRWFGAPSRRMKLSGVTGTNGKTTVAFLIAQSMHLLNTRCAYVGTLGAGIETLERQAGLTTPGCIDLHRNLADFASRGARHTALEVSSHALAQKRVDGLAFDSVLFTNLSRDHVDYHGSMQAYGETKARFILAQDARHRIINIDSDFGRQLLARSTNDAVAVSTAGNTSDEARLFLQMQAVGRDDCGTTVRIRGSWGENAFYLPLAGDFNAANAALVLAQLLCWGIPLQAAVDALTHVTPPPGRMQKVTLPTETLAPTVFVDYAHTPAGLEAVLGTLRAHCKGKLWCVFGCGGDRDKGKRGAMGETVARLADQPVVTTDNARSESPGEIIAVVMDGMPAGSSAIAIEDRAAAIAFAIAAAADEDIVLIAGKGHENYQVVGNLRRPFSDYQVALANLAVRLPAEGRAP